MCERIFAAVKDSCERLQTDYVDVFQVCPVLPELLPER
jgi:aryl-alcohol dehydrogenase-like predicted oxidoreductase